MKTTENLNKYSISERQRRIYQFLLRNSNKENAVSKQRIFDYLDTCDIKIHTNTLYSDIIEIQSNFGVNIKYDQRKKGYILSGSLFEPYEIQLIAQSLQAFKYISNNKASNLTEKLKTLTDRYTADSLNSVGINAVDRIHRQSDSILAQVKRIEKAIQEDKKIRISLKPGNVIFLSHNIRTLYRAISENNGYIISPYNLYWKNGDLYLIACMLFKEYNSDITQNKFVVFRVDHIGSISKPLDMPRDGKEEYEDHIKAIKNKQQFDYDEFMAGEKTQVKMEFITICKGEVLDKFGNDAVLAFSDKIHFTVTQPVLLDYKFYAWMASFGNQAKILWPEEAVQGMKKYLSVVSAVYEDDGET